MSHPSLSKRPDTPERYRRIGARRTRPAHWNRQPRRHEAKPPVLPIIYFPVEAAASEKKYCDGTFPRVKRLQLVRANQRCDAAVLGGKEVALQFFPDHIHVQTKLTHINTVRRTRAQPAHVSFSKSLACKPEGKYLCLRVVSVDAITSQSLWQLMLPVALLRCQPRQSYRQLTYSLH